MNPIKQGGSVKRPPIKPQTGGQTERPEQAPGPASNR